MRIRVAITITTVLFSFFAIPAFAVDSVQKMRVPPLHRAGIIPVQIAGATTLPNDLDGLYKSLETSFAVAARTTRRFLVLNDELVKSLWSSQAGRTELESEYELDAFLNLVVTPLPDTVVLTARLLDKNLKGLLQESVTESREWYQQAGYAQIEGKVTDLAFRLTNRLPTDLSVTSIQGKYITISGGISKGIHKGDVISLIRPYVASLHPANNYWQSFESVPLGTAEVVETKEMNAVARLLSVNREGLVEIGDGARASAIAGRSRYAEKEHDPSPAMKASTIIVPPLYTKDGRRTPQMQSQGLVTASKVQDVQQPAASTVPSPATQDQHEVVVTAPLAGSPPSQNSPQVVKTPEAPVATMAPQAQGDAGSLTGQSAAAQNREGGESNSPVENKGEAGTDYLANFYSPFAFEKVSDVVAKVADRITFQIGQTTWTYTGPGKTGSKFAWYLPVNTVGARITREIIPQVKYGIGGGIGFGKTVNAGSYFSYDSHVRIFWESDLVLGGGAVQKIQAGAQGNFTGLSVDKEKYGGGDWIEGGFFGGALGQFAVPEVIDWYGEFALIPLVIGRVGYNAAQHTVKAAFGWRLGLGGYLATAPQTIEWGGGLDYSGMSLHDSERETGLSTFSLMGMARYRF